MSERWHRVWIQEVDRPPDRSYVTLQWHDPLSGRRRSRSLGAAGRVDPDHAERERFVLEADLNRGLVAGGRDPAWKEFREAFTREYVSARRPNTQRNYRVALDLFERTAAPGRLSAITVRTVSGFAAALRTRPHRRGEGYAPVTVATHLEFLRSALKWAAAQGLLEKVPAFPSVRVPEKRPRPVPEELFDRLLAQAGPDQEMRAYLLCGHRAGLRLDEAYRLRWDEPAGRPAPWVDLGGERIVLPAESVKGRADQWVPLDSELAEALVALAPGAAERAGRVFRFWAKRGPRRELPTAGVSRRVVNLAKSAGVRLTFHGLRRGFGCYWTARVPAPVLQQLLRHRSITTTVKYYANAEEAAAEAVRGRPRRDTRRDTPAGIA